MEILVRPWQKDDLPAVRRILWESWQSAYLSFIPLADLQAYFDETYGPEALCRLYDQQAVYGYLAEKGGVASGFARLQLHPSEGRLYLASLYILPGCQGLGLGRALLAEAGRAALSLGLSELWVGVMVPNRPAVRWYERQGFRFVREEPFRMGGTVVPHLIGYLALSPSTSGSKEAAAFSRIFAYFPQGDRRRPLADLLRDLLASQRRSWPALAEGEAALRDVRERLISGPSWHVLAQFNPARIASTTAAVDEEAVRKRPCFLCRLPAAQQGILYRGGYLVLANPFPVAQGHLTVASLRHRPQGFAAGLGDLLSLARDAGPELVVAYNGPAAGASAPDHLHFQALWAGLLPVERGVNPSPKVLKRGKGTILRRSQGQGRGIIVVEGERKEEVAAACLEVEEGLRRLTGAEGEPLLNALALFREGRWQVMVFPRRRHRPAAYFAPGEERLLVSPGALDMAGVIICPREADFHRLDRRLVEGLFAEVAFTDEQLAAFWGKMF